MVGFSHSASPAASDLGRKAKPYFAPDVPCHHGSAVCDGCMHDVENPSFHLDSVLTQISLYYGMGYPKSHCHQCIRGNRFPRFLNISFFLLFQFEAMPDDKRSMF